MFRSDLGNMARESFEMLAKSAIFATVLAAAAAGMSLSANAAPIGAAGALAAQQESAVEKVYWGGRTVTRCVHGKRVLMRLNRWGRVVSSRVVGRCWFPQRHHHHRRHKHWH